MAAAITLMVAACSSPPPPPPPPTVVDLTLTATPDVNPDASGRPTAVEVRVYELADSHAMLQADFMQIFAHDATALGRDQRDRTDLTLQPGQSQSLRLELKPGSKGVAVVALFRGYRTADWRAWADAPAHRTTWLSARVGNHDVALAPAAPKP